MPPKKKAPAKAKSMTAAAAAALEAKKVAAKDAMQPTVDSSKPLPAYLTQGLTQKDRDVVIDNFSMSTPDGKRELLRSASVRLVYGRHYGLIGQNGIGKSSLLRMISNYEIPHFPEHLRVVHVAQEEIPREEQTKSVIEYVVGSDEQKNYLEAEEQRLFDILEGGGDGANSGDDENMADFEDVQAKLDVIYQRLEEIGARNAEARARSILMGLQFTQDMAEGPINRLSGGWRMRVRLACALFVTPDILLLDEPTNHLDFPAVEWLAGFLRLYEPTLLVVSHDRGFLDQVMTDCIDFRDQTLMYYRGDYSNYLKVRAEHIRQHNHLVEKTEKKRMALQKFIMEARSKAHDDPNLAEQAKTRQRVLDAIPKLEPIREDRAISFTFPEPGKLDHSIMSCKDMYFHYDKDADGVTKPYLLQNINAFIDMGSRIGIMGANGAGKTTLINVLLGKYEPLKGERKFNDQARVRVFTQHHLDQLDASKTPLEFLSEKFPEKREGEMRGFLGRFGLDKKLSEQRIGLLSGGQKSRVAFAVLTCSNPHLIIMDEPTNHLDIETIESLINALGKFSGGVIVISHDRYFLEKTAEEFWAVSAEGEMKIFYDLDEAKAFSYKPITFVLDGPTRKKENKSKKVAELENQDEKKLKQIEAELKALLGEDSDSDDDEAAPAAAVAAEEAPADDAPVAEDDDEDALLAAMAGIDMADEEEPVEEAPVKAKKTKKGKKAAVEEEPAEVDDDALAAMAGFDMADDAEAEVGTKKTKKAGKKGKKAAVEEEEEAPVGDDDDIFAAMAGLEVADEEEEAPKKSKKAGKKGKKAVVEEEPAAEDDDALLAAMAGLGVADDDDVAEEEAPKKGKKAGKKGKKAAAAPAEDEEDDAALLAAMAAMDVADEVPEEEEEAPKKGKKGAKKGKKAAAAAEENGDDDDDTLLAAMAGLDLAGDDEEQQQEEVAPKKAPKKAAKKGKKAAVESDDDGDADALAAIAGLGMADDDEEDDPYAAAAAASKKNKNKGAKTKSAAELALAALAAQSTEKAAPAAAGGKKKKGKRRDDDDDDIGEVPVGTAAPAAAEPQLSEKELKKLAKKQGKKKGDDDDE